MIKLRLQADVPFCLKLRREGSCYCQFHTVRVGQLKILITRVFFSICCLLLPQINVTGLAHGVLADGVMLAGLRWPGGHSMVRRDPWGWGVLSDLYCCWKVTVPTTRGKHVVRHPTGYNLPNSSRFSKPHGYSVAFQLWCLSGALKGSVQCLGFCCLPQVPPLI